MKDKTFIDTNILVYANDRSDKARHERAKRIIIENIRKGNAAVSTQVLSEFYVTVTQKIEVKLSPEIARKEIMLLRSIEIVEIDYGSILKAIQISNQQRLSYWDALIMASALKSMCTSIYTEDMNHGQTVEGVRILNPFIEGG